MALPTDEMNAHVFLDKSRQLLVTHYPDTIERCLTLLSEADVWWRPNEASNSIGNLLLHLNGNVKQWIIGGVAGRPYERNRQQEFDERNPIPMRDLMSGVRRTLGEADQIIGGLDSASLMTRRQIFDEDVTVLEAIYHVTAHFGVHTGQIMLLTKMRTGKDLGIGLRSPVVAPRGAYPL